MQRSSRFRILTSAASLAICGMGIAQSFNIDLDISFGGAESGAGVPSATFGAAANQPGFWNSRGASLSNLRQNLRTLDGLESQVTIDCTASGAGGGSGWMGNTDDVRLLMNDSKGVTLPVEFVFSSLESGHYRLWTYSADAGERSKPTIITVTGAEVPIQYSGLAPMTGNVFQERVSHSIHVIYISGSSLSVRLENMLTTTVGRVNGFQLERLSVPEPSALIFIIPGTLLLNRFGRHKVVP